MRLIISICIVCLLFTACKKYLDVKPKGSFIPSTVSDYDHLLDNSNLVEWNFLDNNRGSLLSYLTDNILLTEGIAKVAYVANNHPNIDHYYAYIFRQPYKNPNASDFFWNSGSLGTYRNISYYNDVIEGVRSIEGNAVNEPAQRAIAQALVARAWSFLNAAMIYGPVYKPAGDNSAKVVPYVTSPDLSQPIPDLSTQQQIFTNILTDLHTALPHAPDKVAWPSRASKAATQALLAYYHLFTRKYDSVVYYANLAWSASISGGVSSVLYDYNGFSWSNPANPASSAIVAQDNFLTAVNNREMLLYRATDDVSGRNTGASPSYPSTEYIGLFDQANDLRYKYFFLPSAGYKTTSGGGYDDGTRVQYYRGNKTKMTEGITYPELLLMRAEGYARTNKLTEAINDLNTLRKYRYKTGTPPLTVGTQDEVIKQVLDERRRELPIGGTKRFLDIKRLALDAGKPWSKAEITHAVGPQSYTGKVDSQDFILTISNTILSFNPQWGIPLDSRSF
jgi:starch-binding outer membrane protein, SusD/RagB family